MSEDKNLLDMGRKDKKGVYIQGAFTYIFICSMLFPFCNKPATATSMFFSTALDSV